MSKKSFLNAPKPQPPKPEDIDRFVAKGTGKDNGGKAKSGRTVNLRLEVPEEMHRNLSIFCVKRGIKMAQLMRELISAKLATEPGAVGK